MVLMNLFAGKQWRHRHREQTCETVGKERVGQMERRTYTLPYVKEMPVGICCMTQGAQTGALRHPRGVGWGGWWEGNSRGRGHMYTYNKLMLMCSKNCHNIVK